MADQIVHSCAACCFIGSQPKPSVNKYCTHPQGGAYSIPYYAVSKVLLTCPLRKEPLTVQLAGDFDPHEFVGEGSSCLKCTEGRVHFRHTDPEGEVPDGQY